MISSEKKESVFWMQIRKNKLIVTVFFYEAANPTVRTFLFLLIVEPKQSIKKIHFHVSFTVP